jgi:hypothetical protein
VRELLRGHSITSVQKKVDQYKKRGWNQLSDVKQDPSLIDYNVIEYVCVMEKEGEPRENKWGSKYHMA